MADEIINSAPDTAASSAPQTTVSEAVSSVTPTAATSADNNTPTVEVVPAEPSTVLGQNPVVEAPAKDTDPAPVAEPKDPNAADAVEAPKDEGSQSDEPAPLPSFESFTLPEGFTADEAQLGEFNKLLGEFENATKADHAEMHKFGQSLLDRHIAELNNHAQKLNDFYKTSWEKQKNDWKESFLKDPDIGGNRQETTVKSALDFIRTHGGTEEQQTEFRNLMETSGVGNHPAMIRLLAKANMAMSEGKPLPAVTPVASNRSKIATRYGNT